MKLTARAALNDGHISVSIEQHPTGFVFVASLADAELMGIALLDGVAKARREASERRSPRLTCLKCFKDCSVCECRAKELIR